MAKSNLDIAENLIRRRKFDIAVKILESCEDTYEGDFEYHLMLGIADLYSDIPGRAYHNFEIARKVKINDVRLLLGQAVIFLRRGEVSRALRYYLDVLELDPDNRIAKKALEFIRLHGDYTTIRKWIDSGDIRKFYPPLGVNPDIIRNILLIAIALCVLGIIVFRIISGISNFNGISAALGERFMLTQEERENPIQQDLPETDYMIELRASEVPRTFNAAKRYFGEGRDNAAQSELNRIIYSNATQSIKQKCLDLATLLREPTFDSLQDNYSYSEVSAEPVLYQDCYIIWDGTAANTYEGSDGSWNCTFLVDYIPSEGRSTITGSVQVSFAAPPSPSVNPERPYGFWRKCT